MKAKTRVTICALLALGFSSIAAEIRTWTSNKGATVTACLTRISGTQVILQKVDGSFVCIDQAALSPWDQMYVQRVRNPRLSLLPSIQNQPVKSLAKPVRTIARSILEAQETDHEAWRDQQQDVRGLRAPVQQVREAEANAWRHGNPINQQVLEPRRQQGGWPMHDIEDNQHSMPSTDESAEQQKQRERKREAYFLNNRAFVLEGMIRSARHKSSPDYKGMAFDAESLADDSFRLGNRSATRHFDDAAADLRKLARDQNIAWPSSSNFDSKLRHAETGVGSGIESLNRFETKSTDFGW